MLDNSKSGGIVMIEVGEYMRTEAGQIVVVTHQIKSFIDEHMSRSEKDYVEFLGKIKHSHQLKDLLQAGDIVNNCLLFLVGGAGEGRKCIWLPYNKTYTEIEEDMIKTVMTKELMEKECFKNG